MRAPRRPVDPATRTVLLLEAVLFLFLFLVEEEEVPNWGSWGKEKEEEEEEESFKSGSLLKKLFCCLLLILSLEEEAWGVMIEGGVDLLLLLGDLGCLERREGMRVRRREEVKRDDCSAKEDKCD
jgi:hypothetical protein